jgi:chaperonin GroEL
MSHKVILYGEDARKEMKRGLTAVANATKITLGPRGRNVTFDKGYGGPVTSNDGVTISEQVLMKDPIQNMGANVGKGAAQKTNEEAGDGTTTTIILADEVVTEGMKKLDVGVNAIGIKNGIMKASKIAVDYLKSVAKPIKSDEETVQVATISAESEEIGKIIAKTVSDLGADAVITIEESPIIGITSEVSQGMEIDKGFINPYMMTDSHRMEASYKKPKILVTDMKIGTIESIVPLLEEMGVAGQNELVIVAEDVVGEALQNLVMNKLRGTFNALCIKAPGFGLRKKDYLEDLAILTGATFISSDLNFKLEDIKMEHLGSAEKVIAKKEKTMFVGGFGKKEDIDSRIALARKELEGIESKHDRLKIEERIAKLSGGVAIMRVGAPTEPETKYLKMKVEDAVSAVQAALEEGIVPGGGVALIGASKAVLEARKACGEEYSYDELIGFDILAKSLESPLRCIATNCGKGDGTSVVSKVKEMKEGSGYDALKDIYVDDMIAAGICDPVKVTRSAIENAASAGSTFLTTEVAIATVVDDEKKMM